MHTLRDPDAFGAYMIRTAINMSKRHRVRSELERRHLEHESASVSLTVSPPDFESADELISSLRSLPHRQRAALVLRFYVDLADADIAEIMGSPVGTIRSLISRGLAGLRNASGDHDA
jgi:RNA polymerase sigma factor (sigma-70 family)